MKKIFLFIICLMVLFAGWFFLFSTKYELEIINNSDQSISKVEVLVSRKSYVLANLLPKTKEKISFSVTQDSDIELSLFSQTGEMIEKKRFGYVTPGSDSMNVVSINKDLKIFVESINGIIPLKQ